MSVVEPRAVRWTREEYHRIAASGVFDGRRVELIRGEVIEMTPQDSLHATGVTAAVRVLQRVFDAGFVVRPQLPLGLGTDTEPEPDVAVVEGDLLDFVESHPSEAVLLLEVSVSSLEHDRTTKRTLYAESGIPEYWLVNLVERQLEVYRAPVGKDYTDCSVLGRADSVAPLARPERLIAVSDLIP